MSPVGVDEEHSASSPQRIWESWRKTFFYREGEYGLPKETLSIEMALSALKAMLSTSVFCSNMTDSNQQQWEGRSDSRWGVDVTGSLSKSPGKVLNHLSRGSSWDVNPFVCTSIGIWTWTSCCLKLVIFLWKKEIIKPINLIGLSSGLTEMTLWLQHQWLLHQLRIGWDMLQ